MRDNEINNDVLGAISECMTPESRMAASSVHRVFYESSMKQRYETLNVSRSDRHSKELLTHIRETPSIASRVKNVRIRPWLVKPCTQSYQSRTENALTRIAAFFDPHYTRKQAELRLQKRIIKDIQRVKSTLLVLPQAYHYTLEWDGRNEYHPELFAAFLLPVLAHWQVQLRCLTLHLPLHFYATMAPLSLPSLETLTVRLDTGSIDSATINILLDAWLVFLHNLKDSLRALSIQSTPSSEELDLSRLFRLMRKLPHLRSISLTIPFDGGHLSTPRPFSQFLTKHAETLECLALKTTRCSTHAKPLEVDSLNWMQSIINSINTPLPRLKSVALALRPLRAPLDPLRRFLQLHAPTLRALALTDRTLTPEEVEHSIITPLSIVPSFTNGISVSLKRLELRVDLLRPRLLHLLAARIPELHTLKLTFPECNRNPALFHSALRSPHFDISRWALRRFIMPPGPNASWIRSLEPVLVECIPAIESVEELHESD